MSLFGSGNLSKVSTNTTATGFSFGAAPVACAASFTGFSLGASTTNAGFSLSNLSTTAASTGGFSIVTTASFPFCAANTTNGTIQLSGVTTSATPNIISASASTSSGLSLGGVPQQSQAQTLAPSLGATTASTFNFAAKPASTPAPVLSNFSYGSNTSAQSLSGSLLTLSSALNVPASSVASFSTPSLSFGAATTIASEPTSLGTSSATSSILATAYSFKSSVTAAKTNGVITTTTGLSTLPAISAPTKQMSYKELEEIIEKWLHDLGEQEKAFLSQAVQVNNWDKQLIENGEKVTLLNNEVERVKAEQRRLDRELDFILSQQEELEELLKPIENQMKSHHMIQHVQHSDVERERTYNLAENIDVQLKRMMEDLREIIERINNSNVTPNQGTDETMLQIGKILNSHMDSLQWIDQNSNQLQKRVGDVNQIIETHHIENNRNFHLSYDRE